MLSKKTIWYNIKWKKMSSFSQRRKRRYQKKSLNKVLNKHKFSKLIKRFFFRNKMYRGKDELSKVRSMYELGSIEFKVIVSGRTDRLIRYTNTNICINNLSHCKFIHSELIKNNNLYFCILNILHLGSISRSRVVRWRSNKMLYREKSSLLFWISWGLY